VPDDVSVVGVNDVPMCEFVEPTLTSVRVPMRRLGHEAWRLIAAQRSGEQVPKRIVLEAELAVRGSTSPRRHHGGGP
jgi:LacI family transcriptional regulator